MTTTRCDVGCAIVEKLRWERESIMEKLHNCNVDLFEKADVKQVVHGHWIPKKYMSRTPFARNYNCSICGADPIGISNYCPNCGSKMDTDCERRKDSNNND